MEDYEIVYDYLNAGSYPSNWSKNDKRILRRRCANNFKISKGVLYYSTKKGGTRNDWRIVVKNDDEKKRIMNACHSNPEGKIPL